MKKHLVVRLLQIFFLATVYVGDAQQTDRLRRIGFLSGGVPGSSRGIPAVQRELRELGYVEGKNIAFEYRYAKDKRGRSRAVADELVHLKVDVIVAGGTGDTLAAKNATRIIPIVFLESVSDPVALGLVDSLAQPGGNITGFTTIAAVLAGKRLELLKETIPKLSRVAVIWNPDSPTADSGSRFTESEARALGLRFQSLKVTKAGDFDNVFQAAKKERAGAMLVTANPLIFTHFGC